MYATYGTTNYNYMYTIPSLVSGRGYKIDPICVCVCHSALSQLNCLVYRHQISHGDVSKLYLGQVWWWRILTKRAWCGRSCQCSSIFIKPEFWPLSHKKWQLTGRFVAYLHFYVKFIFSKPCVFRNLKSKDVFLHIWNEYSVFIFIKVACTNKC